MAEPASRADRAAVAPGPPVTHRCRPGVLKEAASQFGLALVGAYLLSGAVCTLAALRVSKELELRGN